MMHIEIELNSDIHEYNTRYNKNSQKKHKYADKYLMQILQEH